MGMLGRTFILFGMILVVIGIIFVLGVKIPWVGKLPGDIYVQKKNFTFYFPLATSIIVSIIFTLILFLINRK
ncbi:MAG: DUF2905 domain-containing protein [Candidatus Omnitrophica bacterium CG07_land_8_20_14_0_80_42_15]|uniref:DUF2905 domain-containing protein n=1 Tax=Candidatus Aquitaenariimonas noxiae TaxID=1974741 RepID=A0A2J0KZX3_9BACT|nr:MAG: DUF2905 domain-containing protein [Candidatus Omnitrophica bacterium CG07_land_8_20_14_0_80_42_15]